MSRTEPPRDSSAAAIMCSALLELSSLLPESNGMGDGTSKRMEYLSFAKAQLRSLMSPQYRANTGENNNFLLKHATGHFPHKSEVDVPLVYGDYYYLEAIIRYLRLEGDGVGNST